jgi:hypothetical protein
MPSLPPYASYQRIPAPPLQPQPSVSSSLYVLLCVRFSTIHHVAAIPPAAVLLLLLLVVAVVAQTP